MDKNQLETPQTKNTMTGVGEAWGAEDSNGLKLEANPRPTVCGCMILSQKASSSETTSVTLLAGLQGKAYLLRQTYCMPAKQKRYRKGTSQALPYPPEITPGEWESK